MKHIYRFLLMSAVMFSIVSCKQPYLASFCQIVQTRPTEKSQSYYDEEHNCYTYVDKNVKISYDLWSEGGCVNLTVKNLTDDILMVDFSESFVVLNGASNNYTAANLTIAPKSYAVIKGLDFGMKQYMNCDFDIAPDMHKPACVTYNLNNSPYVFRNIITYRLMNSHTEQKIEDQFYVFSIMNSRVEDVLVKTSEMRRTCTNENGDDVQRKVYFNKWMFSPGTGYYVQYTHMTKK